MSNPMILVTGATGKTGSAVVEQLLGRGFPVRAVARRRDERSDLLVNLGAEVVLGDFHDLKSVREAIRGVNRVYFCYPPQGDRLVEATAILATASRDAGIEAVVNMSQITAREDAPSVLSRHHWLSESILDWAGIGAIHIRPTFFAENLYMFGAQTIAAEGKLYLPYGDERHAPVSAIDIARVVVELLIGPAPHVGERYALTGPSKLTIAEIAEVLSHGLGRSVEYVDLPNEAWGDALRGIPGMNEFLVSHLRAVARDYQNGVFNVQTDAVAQICGQTPQSVAEFVQDNLKYFGIEPVASHV